MCLLSAASESTTHWISVNACVLVITVGSFLHYDTAPFLYRNLCVFSCVNYSNIYAVSKQLHVNCSGTGMLNNLEVTLLMFFFSICLILQVYPCGIFMHHLITEKYVQQQQFLSHLSHCYSCVVAVMEAEKKKKQFVKQSWRKGSKNKENQGYIICEESISSIFSRNEKRRKEKSYGFLFKTNLFNIIHV